MTTGFAALIQGIGSMQQASAVNTHTTSRSIRRTRKRVWTGPVRRPAEHNAHKVDDSSLRYSRGADIYVQGSIRKHLLRLLGPSPLLPTVGEAEVLSFVRSLGAAAEDEVGPCCTEENFRIYLAGPPRHPWNRSAATVFAQSYISHHNLTPTPDLVDDLVEDCLVRIKTLKGTYSRTLPTSLPKHVHQKNARREGRKATVRFSPSLYIYLLS